MGRLFGQPPAQVFDAHPNVVFCCAAGNDGSAEPQWPAAYSQQKANVVSVGGVHLIVSVVPWGLRESLPSRST